MKNAINIVRGAITKKTLLPVLTHYRVYGGRIQGGNGRFSIDAPCPELAGQDFCVPAERFLKAVDACDSEPRLHITDGGRLSITRDRFRAFLPLSPVEDYPLAERGVGGVEAVTLGDWLPMLRTLSPFMGEDASRQHFMGVWLPGDGYGYATNNAILARVPAPWGSCNEAIILPGFVVDELLRLGREPAAVEYSAQGITFSFEDGVWLQSRLLEGTWPEQVLTHCQPVGEGAVGAAELLAALLKVRPFCPEQGFPQIMLDGDGVGTAEGEMSARVEGASFPEIKWHADILQLVLEHATRIDFSRVPCPWEGEDGLVGVAVPLRG